MIIIGITGRKRSGKDTIGEYLVKNHGFVRVAFADALKEACKIIFGFSDEQVYGDELKEVVDKYWNHSPREILQKVGSELFRDQLSIVCENIGNDIWIRSVERKIENLQKQGFDRFVVTDVRFENELNFIKKYKNGYTWKVTRNKNNDQEIKVHQSEAMIDELKTDVLIDNVQTIEKLYQTVEEFVSTL